MKLMTYIICLLFLSSAQAEQSRTKYKYPLSRYEELALNDNTAQAIYEERLELLKTIKFHMINGQLDHAKVLLKEAGLSDDFSRTIQFRYLAMIYFIDGNHQEVVKILNQPEMSDFATQSKYCHLNILSMLILNINKNFKQKWENCRKVISPHSLTNLRWLQTIIDLKHNRKAASLDKIFNGISIDNTAGDNLRLYLKLALYLNKQDEVISRFEYFNAKTLEDSIFRELMGMNYYRNIDLVKAFQLLDALNTPNTEVFKGNLFLSQKRYEDAFAQYKLALKAKDDSTNALERLIPLSWKLKRWDEGIKFISMYDFTKTNMLQKYILLAAFNTMAGRDEAVTNNIRKVLGRTNKTEPLELYQIKAYNDIINDKYYSIETVANQSCLKKDGMFCWYLFFHHTWEEPTQKLKNEGIIHQDEDLIGYYTAQRREEPLDQEIFVQQKDIEELDNDLIHLVERN